jgi:hypothetical protein
VCAAPSPYLCGVLADGSAALHCSAPALRGAAHPHLGADESRLLVKTRGGSMAGAGVGSGSGGGRGGARGVGGDGEHDCLFRVWGLGFRA